MALSDTRIHQIELLLTLDYLLHYTDEFNPSTQIDICEYARKYGLKFDKNAKQGNQIRRQRIGDCLKFLGQISEEFTADVPFVLETTDSGKYYVEQRNGLNESQVAKILAAIRNDKYTQDEDVSFLIDRVLSAFSTSEENRKAINNECKNLIRGVKKYDKETSRKINLVEKAYREGKMIKIRMTVADAKSNKIISYFFWYRVYMIKEFHNKLYAFMLSIGQTSVSEKYGRIIPFMDQYIFEPIEKIDVAPGTDKMVLCDDLDPNRDFNKLFQKSCPRLAKKFGTIDLMLERQILPSGGKTSVVSFYFRLGIKDLIRRSFEDFFSEDFHYQKTNMVEGIEKHLQGLLSQINSCMILTDEPKENEIPKYGLVNISVDLSSFKSWLLSDPHGDGKTCISDLITIIKPLSVNEELAEYHYSKLMKKVKYLSDSSKSELFAAIGTNSND